MPRLTVPLIHQCVQKPTLHEAAVPLHIYTVNEAHSTCVQQVWQYTVFCALDVQPAPRQRPRVVGDRVSMRLRLHCSYIAPQPELGTGAMGSSRARSVLHHDLGVCCVAWPVHAHKRTIDGMDEAREVDRPNDSAAVGGRAWLDDRRSNL